MRFLHRERISSKLTVRNTRYRAHLNNRFFKNDPDVFLLKGTQMSEEQKRFILETDRKYADMFLTSDDMSLYTEEDIKLLNELAKE
jgi:alpha-galactosidase